MQLIDFQREQNQSNEREERLRVALEDIASNIHQSNFCIRHPNYQPSELTTEVVACLQQLPADIQDKYLNMQLRNFIYAIYFSGSLALATEVSKSEALENKTVGSLDSEFYTKLHKSNCGQGYLDPGWYVRKESDGLLAVQKNDLTIHIERQQLQLTEQSPNVGDSISVLMPSNLVTEGCYLAVGDAGLFNHNLDHPPQIVNIYFNFTADGAIAVMKSLTQQLNAMWMPFSFQTLYNPDDYNRYDCGILHIERHNYQAMWQVLQNVYTESKSHFQTDVPLFTKFLAPGISLAEEPNTKFVTAENFGANRCRIVANGLQSAWQQGNESKEAKLNCIMQEFSEMEVDLIYPYLNSLPDIYSILN